MSINHSSSCSTCFVFACLNTKLVCLSLAVVFKWFVFVFLVWARENTRSPRTSVVVFHVRFAELENNNFEILVRGMSRWFYIWSIYDVLSKTHWGHVVCIQSKHTIFGNSSLRRVYLRRFGNAWIHQSNINQSLHCHYIANHLLCILSPEISIKVHTKTNIPSTTSSFASSSSSCFGGNLFRAV